jgi:hypothetical protein
MKMGIYAARPSPAPNLLSTRSVQKFMLHRHNISTTRLSALDNELGFWGRTDRLRGMETAGRFLFLDIPLCVKVINEFG